MSWVVLTKLPKDMVYQYFTPGVVDPLDNTRPSIWFAFQTGKLVMVDVGNGAEVPEALSLSDLNIPYDTTYYLGECQGKSVHAVQVLEQAILPPGYFLKDLRGLIVEKSESFFLLAGRARQIVQWDIDHLYCSRCGTKTATHPQDRAKECPQCGYTQYPRLSPCVIGLITRGSEILLARSPTFPEGMFSTLAGFVEPGETLEQAFACEVNEEVGLSIQHITYISSQPWPFPHSLMIGFQAEYAYGDIKVDGIEIQEADWFPIDQLPLIPPTGSISRYLIDRYVENGQR